MIGSQNQPIGLPSVDGLFSPIDIAGTRLRNRFVMPAMQRGWCSGGAPDDRLAEYYLRRVLGGVGLVITESCAVDHVSATGQPSAARLSEATLDAWKRTLAPSVTAGGVILMQLWHEGALRVNADGQTLSPSGRAYDGHQNGRAATERDLDELIDAFASAALCAREAGASGVEVHAAHGYLLDQFLWAKTNDRVDGYGGAAIADRVRLPARIVEAIRRDCGPDFIISLRFSQWKEKDFGARIADTPEDLAQLTGALKKAGCDLLHVSTRRFWEPAWEGQPASLAGWTKRLGGLPTIAVGSVGLDRDVMASFSQDGEARDELVTSFAALEKHFAAGEFDMIAVGRGLIADPDWVRKVEAGDFNAVRPFRKADIDALGWE